MKDLILLLDKLGLVGMKMQLAESSNLTNDVPTTSVYDVLKKLLEAECEYTR
ncbi:hypothetical protein [Candidatus Tisiphia endosymbiont of Nedyus quadrimaculatus]|uniref:hypothetical protein n=1 Tax=Candidatus Tisiphia endosymbiont of Nedyus quadrimaculatus TaxID=3139332 RepID=UPI00345E6A10